jgi:hypothetical protein
MPRGILLDYARRIVIVFEAMLLGKCGVLPRRFSHGRFIMPTACVLVELTLLYNDNDMSY